MVINRRQKWASNAKKGSQVSMVAQQVQDGTLSNEGTWKYASD